MARPETCQSLGCVPLLVALSTIQISASFAPLANPGTAFGLSLGTRVACERSSVEYFVLLSSGHPSGLGLPLVYRSPPTLFDHPLYSGVLQTSHIDDTPSVHIEVTHSNCPARLDIFPPQTWHAPRPSRSLRATSTPRARLPEPMLSSKQRPGRGDRHS